MALSLTVTPSSGNYIEDRINIKITGGSVPSNATLWVITSTTTPVTTGNRAYYKAGNLGTNFNITCPYLSPNEDYGLFYVYNSAINTPKIYVRFLIGNEDFLLDVTKTMYIKPQIPTFHGSLSPTYEDTSADAYAITNNNKVLVNNLSTPYITDVLGNAYKGGYIKSAEINGIVVPYREINFEYQMPIINTSNLELSITLIDSRGWRSNKLVIADASKFRYKKSNIKINNLSTERDGISEITKLSADGYYLEGYQSGTSSLTSGYSWKENGTSNPETTGETSLTIVKRVTQEWTDFNNIINEYEHPQYTTDGNTQYYTGTQWNNGIGTLFNTAISYNNKYTQAYLEADYDSVNDRYKAISGGYNGSWHNFWLDTIKAIYEKMYGDDGYGGNYEWEIEETIIKGDTTTGFSMDKSFNVSFSISESLTATSSNKNSFIDTALPAIDVYKNNVAFHGLYDDQVDAGIQMLGKVAFNGEIMSDFIIEHGGTSGTNYYAKYNSGLLIQWGYSKFTDKISTSAGALYRTDSGITKSLAQSFINTNYFPVLSGLGGYVNMAYVNERTVNSITFFPLTTWNVNNSNNKYVFFVIFGRWKD